MRDRLVAERGTFNLLISEDVPMLNYNVMSEVKRAGLANYIQKNVLSRYELTGSWLAEYLSRFFNRESYAINLETLEIS